MSHTLPESKCLIYEKPWTSFDKKNEKRNSYCRQLSSKVHSKDVSKFDKKQQLLLSRPKGSVRSGKVPLQIVRLKCEKKTSVTKLIRIIVKLERLCMWANNDRSLQSKKKHCFIKLPKSTQVFSGVPSTQQAEDTRVMRETSKKTCNLLYLHNK